MASFSFSSRRSAAKEEKEGGEGGEKTVASEQEKLFKELSKYTAVCSRVHRQINDYREQMNEEQQRVDALKSDPDADEYDVKKAQEIVVETENLIPTLVSQVCFFFPQLFSFSRITSKPFFSPSIFSLILIIVFLFPFFFFFFFFRFEYHFHFFLAVFFSLLFLSSFSLFFFSLLFLSSFFHLLLFHSDS
jgi:hypothetical protein